MSNSTAVTKFAFLFNPLEEVFSRCKQVNLFHGLICLSYWCAKSWFSGSVGVVRDVPNGLTVKTHLLNLPQ